MTRENIIQTVRGGLVRGDLEDMALAGVNGGTWEVCINEARIRLWERYGGTRGNFLYFLHSCWSVRYQDDLLRSGGLRGLDRASAVGVRNEALETLVRLRREAGVSCIGIGLLYSSGGPRVGSNSEVLVDVVDVEKVQVVLGWYEFLDFLKERGLGRVEEAVGKWDFELVELEGELLGVSG